MGDHFGDKLFQQSGAVVSGAESKDGFGVARMENRIGVLCLRSEVSRILQRQLHCYMVDGKIDYVEINSFFGWCSWVIGSCGHRCYKFSVTAW
jgi:hypothetical protein